MKFKSLLFIFLIALPFIACQTIAGTMSISDLPATYVSDCGEGSSYALNNYTFLTTADASSASWEVLGTNNGDIFIMLDSRRDITFSTGIPQQFNISNSESFRWYYFVLRSGFQGGSSLEVNLSEDPAVQYPTGSQTTDFTLMIKRPPVVTIFNFNQSTMHFVNYTMTTDVSLADSQSLMLLGSNDNDIVGSNNLTKFTILDVQSQVGFNNGIPKSFDIYNWPKFKNYILYLESGFYVIDMNLTVHFYGEEIPPPVPPAGTGFVVWDNATATVNTDQGISWTSNEISSPRIVVFGASGYEYANSTVPASGTSYWNVNETGTWWVRMYNDSISLVSEDPLQVFTKAPGAGLVAWDNTTSYVDTGQGYTWTSTGVDNPRIIIFGTSGDEYLNITVPASGTSAWTVNETGIWWVRLYDDTMSQISGDSLLVSVVPPPPAPVARWNATPNAGFVPLSISFTDMSNGTLPMTHFWDFGEGNYSADKDPTNIFVTPGNYSVKETVTNADGSDSFSQIIAVFSPSVPEPAPTARWNATPNAGYAPLSVSFVDLSSGKQPMTYFWDFDNGNTSSDQNETNIFVSPGNYSVTETVTNSIGTDSFTQFIMVFEVPIPPPAIGIVMWENTAADPDSDQGYTWLTTGIPGRIITITGPLGTEYYNSTVTETGASSWLMNETGAWTVSLFDSIMGLVSSDVLYDPATTTTTPPTTVPPTTPAPGAVCDFNGTPRYGLTPLQVDFVDMSTATDPLSWTWDFENTGGVNDINQNATYYYVRAGLYSVRHTVTNATGTYNCTKYDYILVEVPQLITWDSGETWISYQWNPAMIASYGGAAIYVDNKFLINVSGGATLADVPTKYIQSNLNPSESHTIVIYNGTHVNETCCEGVVLGEKIAYTQPPLVLNLILFLIASGLLVFAWISESGQNRLLASIFEIIITVYALTVLYHYPMLAFVPLLYIAGGFMMILLTLYDLWRQNMTWT